MAIHTGEQLANEGIAQSSGAANPLWKAEVYQIGVDVSKQRSKFTSNDIRDVHDVIGKHFTPNWSALGQIMRDLAKAGFIKDTGEFIRSPRASQRRRPLRVWRSLVTGN